MMTYECCLMHYLILVMF